MFTVLFKLPKIIFVSIVEKIKDIFGNKEKTVVQEFQEFVLENMVATNKAMNKEFVKKFQEHMPVNDYQIDSHLCDCGSLLYVFYQLETDPVWQKRAFLENTVEGNDKDKLFRYFVRMFEESFLNNKMKVSFFKRLSKKFSRLSTLVHSYQGSIKNV